jgi:hypothetical protein
MPTFEENLGSLMRALGQAWWWDRLRTIHVNQKGLTNLNIINFKGPNWKFQNQTLEDGKDFFQRLKNNPKIWEEIQFCKKLGRQVKGVNYEPETKLNKQKRNCHYYDMKGSRSESKKHIKSWEALKLK